MWGKTVQRRLTVALKIFGFKNKTHLKLLVSGGSMLLHNTEVKKYINIYGVIKYMVFFVFFSIRAEIKALMGYHLL